VRLCNASIGFECFGVDPARIISFGSAMANGTMYQLLKYAAKPY